MTIRFIKNLLIFILLVICLTTNSFADSTPDNLSKIAVLYPTVSKEHNEMFLKYIEGITSISGYNFIPLRITDKITVQGLSQWSIKNKIKGYIALGQTTYNSLFH